MERNFSNLRKLVLVAFLSVGTLLAANAGKYIPIDKNDMVSVTSLGASEGAMVFNLKYDNADEDKLVITLSDNEGFVLYKEILTAKSIDKTFKTSSDVGAVLLTVTNLRDKTAHKFSISNEKRIVEEVSITNLK